MDLPASRTAPLTRDWVKASVAASLRDEFVRQVWKGALIIGFGVVVAGWGRHPMLAIGLSLILVALVLNSWIVASARTHFFPPGGYSTWVDSGRLWLDTPDGRRSLELARITSVRLRGPWLVMHVGRIPTLWPRDLVAAGIIADLVRTRAR